MNHLVSQPNPVARSLSELLMAFLGPVVDLDRQLWCSPCALALRAASHPTEVHPCAVVRSCGGHRTSTAIGVGTVVHSIYDGHESSFFASTMV